LRLSHNVPTTLVARAAAGALITPQERTMMADFARVFVKDSSEAVRTSR
jgi:hypothetical protein